MPAKNISQAAKTAAEVDAALPRGAYVKRGDIIRALGLTREEVRGLIETGVFVAQYPVEGGRMRFWRSQVMAYAHRMELQP